MSTLTPAAAPTLTPTIMVQGTTSDAGKSILVTGLCRILYRLGCRVVPFKPQNMALNSAVTEDGGEIGRAQAVQAFACGLAPHTDMNPILLKPTTDKKAQVIIHGKATTHQDAIGYHDYKKFALTAVLDSYARLSNSYEAIIVEGAGSPAEINLRENDIANMGFAEEVDCPVILIADIDRGGVFAHIVGTLALLSQSEQDRVKGFVINRFRGDIALLQNGLDWLEKETHKPVLGVLPYIQGLYIEAEDALSFNGDITSSVEKDKKLKVIVPALPRISNHTDFDALQLHPNIDFQIVGPNQKIPSADLIILPGSKAVIADLLWLKDKGWDKAINHHLRYGGKVLGICGGYQMLGNTISDPLGVEGFGVEGEAESVTGLAMLDVDTVLEASKHLENIVGHLTLSKAKVTGYEIHAGRTSGSDTEFPMLRIGDRSDGAISQDKQVMGCYTHGLFDSTEACDALLKWAGLDETQSFDFEKFRSSEIDRLADAMEAHLDIEKIQEILAFEPKNNRVITI